MLTNNRAILARLDSLEKQIEETKAEIQDRFINKRADNEGYVIFRSEGSDKYFLLDKDFVNSFQGGAVS